MIIIFRNHLLTSHCELHGDSKQGVKEEVIYAEMAVDPTGRKRQREEKLRNLLNDSAYLCVERQESSSYNYGSLTLEKSFHYFELQFLPLCYEGIERNDL